MEATSQPAESTTPASVARPATARPFPWSRTQAVALLARFIVGALAAALLALLAQVAPGTVSPAALPGFAFTLALGEALGLSLCAVEWRDYGWRALSRGAEVWPALAAAVVAPVAVLGALVLVVYTLIASGVYTVALSRGVSQGRIGGETARRVVVAVANAGFIVVVAARWLWPALGLAEPIDMQSIAWASAGVCLLACVRAAVDIVYWARGAARN